MRSISVYPDIRLYLAENYCLAIAFGLDILICDRIVTRNEPIKSLVTSEDKVGQKTANN